MAAAAASGPFQWPLIDGIAAVNGAGGVAVESKRCCKSRLVSFLLNFPNAEPAPIFFPDSRVERSIESQNSLYGKLTSTVEHQAMDDLAEARRRVELIARRLPSSVNAARFGVRSKAPYLLLCAREALILAN